MPSLPSQPFCLAAACTAKRHSRSLPQTIALEELPDNRGGVDFRFRPGVPKPVDADHANFRRIAAFLITHCRERASRIFPDYVGLASIVPRPSCESVRNTLD